MVVRIGKIGFTRCSRIACLICDLNSLDPIPKVVILIPSVIPLYSSRLCVEIVVQPAGEISLILLYSSSILIRAKRGEQWLELVLVLALSDTRGKNTLK